MSFTEDYIDAWNAKDVDRFVAQFNPNGLYTDVSLKITFAGENEIRTMIGSAFASQKNDEFKHLRGTCDGRFFAIEWTHRSVSKVDGLEYTVHAASVGDLDKQGRILEVRDYWNPAHYPSGDLSGLAPQRETFEKMSQK